MSYLYKGVDITTFFEAGKINNNSYKGFQTNPTPYSGYKPLDLPYKLPDGTSLSSLCTAKSNVYSSSQTVTIPRGATGLRAIIVGGGGGAGGNSGQARVEVTNGGSRTGAAGPGGPGGAGQIKYYELISNNLGTTLNVTVGSGGNKGNNTGDDNTYGNLGGLLSQTYRASTGTAGQGGKGNNSSINIPNISITETASGGNGGGGGGGASAYYGANGNAGANNGSTGGTGASIGSVNNNPNLSYPPSSSGAGGAYNSGGATGSVTIIWLFN